MSRLLTHIDGRRIVISEHGYFVTDNKTVGFDELPGIDYVDFNGFSITTHGRHLWWDGRPLRERIRKFLRTQPPFDP